MNRARPAPPVFPFTGHRTLAEVARDERFEQSRSPVRSPANRSKSHAA